jgi:RHH-type proline utilization regulon transcriptional repressor/proline dehydrogenase/delta 1-pyrroline-5-carboxylate dehydrogenase
MNSVDFYQIKRTGATIDSDEWNIEHYIGYSEIIFKDGLSSKIKDVIEYINAKNYDLPFRMAIEVGTIQLLCGFFPKNKTVYIASKQLSHELTLTKNSLENGFFNQIYKHAQKIATIPLHNTPAVIDIITFKNGLANFNDEQYKRVHEQTQIVAQELVEKVGIYKQTWFEKLSDFGLELTANYMLVRIHLLKFLAILPSLDHDKSGQEVKKSFLEALRRLASDSNIATNKKLKGQQRGLPRFYIIVLQVLLTFARFIPASLLASIIRYSVSLMAKRFIAGENIDSCKKSLQGLIDSDRDATLDQLGELVVSNKEADEYEQKVIEIIEGLEQHIVPGSRNKAGINQAHVSIKVSALSNDFRPYAFEQTYEKVAPRLRKILLKAKEKQVFINIDAEHYHYRDIVLAIYAKVLKDTELLQDYKDTGIVVQAYLRDGHKHFFDVLNLAKERSLRMPIRLVKGAYWDVETVEAHAHNFDAPEFLNKEETDIHFRQIIELALKNSDYIQLALASHNILDHSFAEALRKEVYPTAPVIEHQCLHMTYEALSVGLSLMGWPTRNYIPIGNLLVGMAYLVRRIMENSSQVGILTIMRSHKKAMSFQNPKEILDDKLLKKEIVYDESISNLSRNFKNIYPIRSYLNNHFRLVKEEFDQMVKRSKSYDYIINHVNGQKIVSSSDPDLQIGCVALNTLSDVENKVRSLFDGYMLNHWKDNHSLRYAKLLMLSDKLLFHREELTALIMLEAGKTLDEAIADVDEAIDFIQFYVKGHEEIHSFDNVLTAKGVFGIIAPWNFPLAIPVGMTTAALACGNTVLLKPAEQTPLIALKFLEYARECGIGEDIFDIAIGEGDIGAAIVDHKLINGVVFTGSKAVGTQIFKKLKASMTDTSYGHSPIPKTVITEMGGKNAIIVTNNCELDETVSGVIYSAFAHSGQKCSAASRVIIDEEVKESFITRFVEAVKDLKVGKSYDFDTVINPLITQEDQIRVKNTIQQAKAEVEKNGGRVLLDLSDKDYPGYCVGPAVFEVSSNRALEKESIAQKEIFGPVVHIIPYKNLEEAIKIYNATEYALTGGVYCQSQDDIDYLLDRLESGNIYINRPNTGARVAIEPFGGFKMSGTGPKAGSMEYLYSFLRGPVDVNDVKTYGENQITLTGQSFIKAKASGLSFRNRLERLLALMDEILSNYEVYFQKIDEYQKDSLLDLKQFFLDKKNNVEVKEYPNRKIPGQISYTKRNHCLETGAIIYSNEEISLSSFVEVLVNLYLGNGINIFCLNEHTYQRWQSILTLMYREGFSAYNISCVAINEDELTKILNNDDFEFVVFDYNSTLYQALVTHLLTKERAYMPKVLVSDVDLRLGNWERFVDAFTHSRSFAINTMRHGAPLEIDLE